MAYSFPRLENVYHNVVEAKEYEKQREKYVKENIVNKNVEVSTEFEQVLSINHVEWKYREQIKPVLENVTLEIRRGESIALIGESGSGKTTLSDIILGLLHPQKGSVYMDGIDVYGMPEEWAKVIGYVPQSVFLIDDTIRNNVAFGLKNVDDTDIWYALEQAQLKKFVESLPEGLDTMVGEQGIKFSGGQRQRVAIARALFSRPQILVLDEATAALDNETEAAVMEAIDALQGKMTLIIVAHRLSTIRNCDKIYEICNGRAELRKKVDILKG
jgi:ABC-type multidrug transport system fused ATPase/permease subunit